MSMWGSSIPTYLLYCILYFIPIHDPRVLMYFTSHGSKARWPHVDNFLNRDRTTSRLTSVSSPRAEEPRRSIYLHVQCIAVWVIDDPPIIYTLQPVFIIQFGYLWCMYSTKYRRNIPKRKAKAVAQWRLIMYKIIYTTRFEQVRWETLAHIIQASIWERALR